MSTVDLTVVVPAYNEERRLGPTLETISAYLSAPDSHWTDWELIVVDDGSTDRTREIADAVAARDHRIRVLRLGRNRGKGHALRAGVLASYGRRVLVTDADLAAPITELERLSKALTDGHSAAIGSRATDGATIERHQHRIRELLGRGGNFLIRGVAVPGIRDTQCGFKLFDGERARTAFAASRLTGWGIDVEILQYFRRRSWPVAEVPVRWAHQPGSKVRPLDYARVLAELSRLTARKPFHRPAAALRALRGADLAVAALFLLASTLLYAGRWADPGGRYLVDSMQDQNQWEWFFAVTADNVARLDNPLYTTLQGYPDGVNLMANTAMLGLSIPFAPVTWMFGPAVTLNLVMTLGLAATAVCWYWLLVRRFTGHRGAAATGAALATFAPPMISHANAHPNFVVLFMMPLIVDRALRLCEGRRVVRDGIVLGLMATYQIFLGEEPLLLAAMGMLLFAAGYGLARRDVARAVWRPLGRGLLIALAVCLPLVAFPLSWQFFGPQSYTHVVHGDNTGNSPLALLSFAERSLAGDAANAAALSANPTEQNAFYGWPLLTLTTAIVIVLWRRTAVKALAFTAFAAAALSLGIRVPVPFTDLALPGPWKLLASAPLFESVIESRVAMICAPVLGILLALALDAARTAEGAVRHAVPAAAVAALLPLFPLPLKAVDRAPVPAFIADGNWREYVDTANGESLVPVPLPDPAVAEPLHWQTTADLGFRLPGGYFNGPYGPDRIGVYGSAPRWTSNMLRDVRYSGKVPEIGDAWREQARRDLDFWRAGAVVVVPQPGAGALRQALEQLLGHPGKWRDGVWLWDLPPRN
ncbi:glycosyltransferase family 2 protein [Streptomyces uncialis]|uniref:dolichyl-phosphate beta-glucosyltransferase n=1 Tax=Streptomyces uncialis TaxID=1048205 RepID=UPI002E328D1D|nr:dolichyl-phosphate beta-glucosyltransferase [Streptomyces uncialis]